MIRLAIVVMPILLLSLFVVIGVFAKLGIKKLWGWYEQS